MRTGLLIALLLPFCSAAPLETNVDAEADRVQDGTHSHREGNAYIHNKADIDVSFSGNTEFNDLSIGHHMEVNVHGDGGGLIQVCTAGKVNLACFCDDGQEGGQDCAAEQVCTSGGACLDVCTAGKVNQACFCDNSQEGGQDCAAEQFCTSGGACLDVLPRQNIGIADLGIADCLSGWFDVQGQGVNNDYCRWVGDCGCRGHCSWWSCALAGTNTLLSPKGEYSQPELPRQQITHDLGIADCLSGWFDVQEQGVNNDYCRWVGICGCRGHCSWWSCALAGTNALLSPKGEYSQPVCIAGKVNQACFCGNGQEGGQDCAAQQVCTTGGACLDVCTAGKVNQACFCDNGQGGGQDCAAQQVCTSGGACLDVTCPGEDGLSSVLLENKWRTQDQINAMTEDEKINTVIAEVVQMTSHTTADLERRGNDEVISIANMAAFLIKYSIKSSSDVKTMTYEPDLRNALITEISRHPSIEVSQLQSKTDDQLLKIFCKACPADAKITSDCMCGGNSCTVGNVCVAGSTCTPACSRERKKLVSDCFCSTIFESVLCPAGNICNQDGMCMDVCNDDENKILKNGCYCGPQLQPCRKGSSCFATSDEADAMCHPNTQVFFLFLG